VTIGGLAKGEDTGLGAMVALTVIWPNPILLLILVFGGLESWRRWRVFATPTSLRSSRAAKPMVSSI